jgi:hypothetical protein
MVFLPKKKKYCTMCFAPQDKEFDFPILAAGHMVANTAML